MPNVNLGQERPIDKAAEEIYSSANTAAPAKPAKEKIRKIIFIAVAAAILILAVILALS